MINMKKQTILSIIDKLHTKYPYVDLNSILNAGANEIGYASYNANVVTDNDLLAGLNVILKKKNIEWHSCCFGYYDGKLI